MMFTSATVDNFKKINKEANKLKRTLAGFDEMNMLNDNGTTGALGGIGANLSDIYNEKQKALKWLNKLENKVEEVKKIFLKFGNWNQFELGLGQLKGAFEKFVEGLKLVAKGILVNLFRYFYFR